MDWKQKVCNQISCGVSKLICACGGWDHALGVPHSLCHRDYSNAPHPVVVSRSTALLQMDDRKCLPSSKQLIAYPSQT
ncbi:hypothetical protein GALMADRAFT_247420 [Galerina marginata CBS 339.88]|uniref:Uncharacterized protein n=1 Tax=Galerina marginata (strain CBS 339.88) TaxID=685588 RepID=A0A067SZ16_GALM3|nr:hypothetical protein GALMADRAFT_247420 [Galerina marginata CBS 339.88]